jgi:hypothetical protein
VTYSCDNKYVGVFCYSSKAVFTAESQRAQSEFFFSLSAERPESEKQQPFG